MKKVFSFFTILFAATIVFGQDINIGIQDTVDSKILNQERAFSVYLPPSYYSAPNQKYPVLYILDGAYNFQYVAGLLELEAGISERIPEMILVAISGKGTATYRNNCKPNIEGIEDKGNADKVADFIEKELIPYVNSKYKSNNYKVLSGHSIGGLFVINTSLNHPQLFNQYIAISPALWWAGNAINDVAKQKINNNNFKANVFVSLANEPGMGVDSFLAVATSSILKNTMVVYGIGILFVLIAIIWGFKRKKVLFPIVFALIGIGISAYLMFCYYPINDNFKFKQFASENHNSVGLPTYRWALENQFKTWQVENEYFTSTDEMKNYFEKVKSTYGTSLGFSNTLLGNTYFILKDNPSELAKVADYLKTNDAVAYENFEIFRANKALEKEPKEAEKLINEVLKLNPQSTESYHLLSKIKVAEKNKIIADSLINKSLDLASDQNERQWKINELIETKNEVSAMQ